VPSLILLDDKKGEVGQRICPQAKRKKKKRRSHKRKKKKHGKSLLTLAGGKTPARRKKKRKCSRTNSHGKKRKKEEGKGPYPLLEKARNSPLVTSGTKRREGRETQKAQRKNPLR